MGRAGGGAEALCAVLLTGLPFCVQNLSSQITQPREPPLVLTLWRSSPKTGASGPGCVDSLS